MNWFTIGITRAGLRSRASPLRNLRNHYLVIDQAPASSGQVAHVLRMRPHFEVRIAAEFILDLFNYFLKQYPRAFAVVGRFDQGLTTVRRYRDLAIRPAAKLIEIVHPAGPLVFATAARSNLKIESGPQLIPTE
jgi:hypothetical protein